MAILAILVNRVRLSVAKLSASETDICWEGQMTILQHIESATDQLAQSERKVAEAILDNPHLLEHYTITSLAQHSGTSTSAVLRFCHSLGYAGFKEFRFELIAELQRDTEADPAGNDPLLNAAEGLAEATRRLSELDRTLLDELASQITQSQVVFCLGIHRSALPAEKLRMDMEDLGILAVSCGNGTHATHLANLVSDRCCLIVFSESGSSASFRAALDAGLAAQGHSWIITSNPRPQLATSMERVIVLPSARRAGAGPVDEHPVAMAFVELLVLQIRERLA